MGDAVNVAVSGTRVAVVVPSRKVALALDFAKKDFRDGVSVKQHWLFEGVSPSRSPDIVSTGNSETTVGVAWGSNGAFRFASNQMAITQITTNSRARNKSPMLDLPRLWDEDGRCAIEVSLHEHETCTRTVFLLECL